MAEQQKTGSADEKLHQETTDDKGMKVVYDNETAQQHAQAKASKEQDEGLADTFPASDVPAASNPTFAPAPDTKSP